MGKLYLVYGERITKSLNSKGLYEYELYFSEAPEIVWGEDWNSNCPSACDPENIRPDETTYQKIMRVETEVPLNCIGDNSCFSCQDMMDQIVACVWEDISTYDEYPEPLRLVFKYGEEFEKVEAKLRQRDIVLETDEKEEPQA